MLTLEGQPVTVDLLRQVLGTPQPDRLKAAPVPQVLDYPRYMVDPVKAGTQRQDFTLSVEGDPATYRLQLRNGVLIPSRADAPSATHLMLTRAQMADLVLGTGTFPGTGGGLAGFDTLLDRRQFLSREAVAAKLAAPPNQPQGDIRPANRGRGNVRSGIRLSPAVRPHRGSKGDITAKIRTFQTWNWTLLAHHAR